MADWMPGANAEPVGNHGSAMFGNMGLVLHVQEGLGDLHGWFNNPAASASSHFQVRKDGAINQFVPMSIKAWCQGNGNGVWHSVETEGYHNEALTDAQITGVAKIFQFGGWKLQLSDSILVPGLGWHGMGGAAWGGHYGCPGDLRKAQRTEILRRAGGVAPPGPEKFPAWPGRFLRLTAPLPMSGKDVLTWQTQMIHRNWTITADGVYGPQSDGVCRAFQKQKGLSVDGIVGKATWDACWKEPTTTQ